MALGKVYFSADAWLSPNTLKGNQVNDLGLSTKGKPDFWKDRTVKLDFKVSDFLISLCGLLIFSYPIYVALTANRKIESVPKFETIYEKLDNKNAADTQKVHNSAAKLLNINYNANDIFVSGSSDSYAFEYLLKFAVSKNNKQLSKDIFALNPNPQYLQSSINSSYDFGLIVELIQYAFDNPIVGYDPMNYVFCDSGYIKTFNNLIQQNPDKNNLLRETFKRYADRKIDFEVPPGEKPSDDHHNALRCAAASDGISADVLEFLVVRLGSDVNHPDPVYGMTPLHCACAANRKDKVLSLLDLGANIEARGKSGKRPIYMALQGGYVEILAELLSPKRNPNKDTIVTVAMERYNPIDKTSIEILFNPDTLQNFIDNGLLDVNDKSYAGFTAFHIAAMNGFDDCIAVLAKAINIDTVSNDNATAMYLAAQANHWKVVDKLIDLGANPNISAHMRGGKAFMNILHMAIAAGEEGIVKKLIGKMDIWETLDTNDDHILPAELAFLIDPSSSINGLLLTAGAQINLKDKILGYTRHEWLAIFKGEHKDSNVALEKRGVFLRKNALDTWLNAQEKSASASKPGAH